MAQLNLTKRSELSQALTHNQVDANWTAIENAVNSATGLYYLQGFAISDETTDLTTGTKLTAYLPVGLTDMFVHGCVTTAPTGASLIIDIHVGGTTIMTTNKIEIDVSEFNTNTAATAPTLTTTTYTAFTKVEIIIDQIGSTVAGTGAKVWIGGNII
jgi:hypothetical protein